MTTTWERFDALLKRMAESFSTGNGMPLSPDENKFMGKVRKDRMILAGKLEREFTFMLDDKLINAKYLLVRQSHPSVDIRKAKFTQHILTDVDMPVTIEQMAAYTKAKEAKEHIVPSSGMLPKK